MLSNIADVFRNKNPKVFLDLTAPASESTPEANLSAKSPTYVASLYKGAIDFPEQLSLGYF